MYATPQVRTSKAPGSLSPDCGCFCKIVTFYEDFADAIRATLKFDSIVQAVSGGRPVRATSWSFDLLGKAELNSIILEDVAKADVLVVASRGGANCRSGSHRGSKSACRPGTGASR